MGGVEDVKLQLLKRLAVIDDLGARCLPGWPRPREAILDHPLRESLAHHGDLVAQAERGVYSRATRSVGCGNDAVDHGPWKACMVFDPGGERGIDRSRKGMHRALELAAIVREVVTAHNRHRSAILVLPRCESANKPADSRDRRVGMRKVMADVRVIRSERALAV